MEVGVRLIGVILRILDFLLAPIFWWRTRNPKPLPPPPTGLLLLSVTSLVEALKSGELTSEEIVTTYIARCKLVNPYINAVVDERYRAATEDARAVDRAVARARSQGAQTVEKLFKEQPLLGVPVTIKESCSLAGLSNATGFIDRAGSRATIDGGSVRKIKEAGAIPLLVSNTPELCLGWETHNLITGTTNNPYCLERSAGGSSGGEAALIASGASPAGVASDIAGSIRLPAAFCGVFGHKPTPGVVPIDGHVPTLRDARYRTLLAAGPLARSARDLPLLLTALADHPGTLRLDEPVDFTKLKVLYMTEATTNSIAVMGVDKATKDMITNAAKYLERECGCTISEKKFKAFEDSVEMSVSVFFSMKDIPNMLQDPANPKRSLCVVVELVKLWLGGARRSLQALAFCLLLRSRLLLPARAQRRYCGGADLLRAQIQAELGSSGVLLYPAWGGPAPAHGRVPLAASRVLYSMLVNVLGLPATVVPQHRAAMPTALQVIAAPNQDRLCLAVAQKLEEAFGGWKPPQ